MSRNFNITVIVGMLSCKVILFILLYLYVLSTIVSMIIVLIYFQANLFDFNFKLLRQLLVPL